MGELNEATFKYIKHINSGSGINDFTVNYLRAYITEDTKNAIKI